MYLSRIVFLRVCLAGLLWCLVGSVSVYADDLNEGRIDHDLLARPIETYKHYLSVPSSELSLDDLLRLALLQYWMGLDDKFQKTLEHLHDQRQPFSVAQQALHFYLQGVLAVNQGEYEDAQQYFQDGQNKADSLPLEGLWVLNTQELAFNYASLENYETAFELLGAGLQRAEAAGDDFSVALVQWTLSAVYLYTDDVQQGIHYARESLNYFESAQYPMYVAESLLTLAAAYRYEGNWQASLDVYDDYFETTAFEREYASAFPYHYGRSTTLSDAGRCEEALQEIALALSMGGGVDYRGELYKRQAACMVALNNTAGAIEALHQARMSFEGTGLDNAHWRAELYLVEADILVQGGEYQQALELYKSYHSVFSEVELRKRSETMTKLKKSFERERQEAQIQALQHRNELQKLALETSLAKQESRNVLIAAVVVMALLLLAFALFQTRRSRRYYQDSVTDTLTSLYNRRFMMANLDRWISVDNEQREEWAIISFDIDHFKSVNDQYGHLTGDRLLVACSETLAKVTRYNDLLGRVGGEEFMCLLPRTSLQTAHHIADRMRQALQACKVESEEGAEVSRSASFGVAVIRTGESVESILRRVDEALYRAKSAGRNRVELADEGN